MELGSVWSRLGSDVLVVELLDRLLPGTDREMATQLQRSLEDQGLHFRLQTQVEAAEVQQGDIHLTLQSATEHSTVVAERVLMAVGRRPFTEGLGLAELGVAQD